MPALPIATGSVLQDRYRIVGVAGQGQFGQTYLARDQKRLSELCVLKEFLPVVTDPAELSALEQQFTQRARVLYGLQHPQVPSYQYMLHENQRFYWVREYIEGKSYGVLLDERTSQGQAFSEQEVVQCLLRVLPVLHYLHGQTVIHRNLSLDSLIVRQSDQLPVLISFGLVTELVAQLQLHPVDDPSERHGRWGFAPPEQFQTGQVFPNSDLYALGMVAIALLSGKEPEDLYDESDRVIHWEPWVVVHPELRNILRRLLQPAPHYRFSSAAEVVQALQRLIQGGAHLSKMPARIASTGQSASGAASLAASATMTPELTVEAPPEVHSPGSVSSDAAENSNSKDSNSEDFNSENSNSENSNSENSEDTVTPRTAMEFSPSRDRIQGGAISAIATDSRADTLPGASLVSSSVSTPLSTTASTAVSAVPQSVERRQQPASSRGVLTKQSAKPSGSSRAPKPGERERRIDLTALLLLIGLIILCSLVSWRIFAFLRTQPEGATRTPVAPAGPTQQPAGTASPSNGSPTGTASQDESSTQAALRSRRRNLGIDYRFLADLVDEIFYAKHPEWRGKTLDARTEQGAMRQEWLALSNTTMDKLETLPPELRRKLGSYKPVEYQTWLSDLGETGRSSPTLDGLADQRLVELFPDLKGKPLNPKTTGQVWYALAESQLPQAKRQKSPAKP